MRTNKELRSVAGARFKEVRGKLMLYALVFLLIPVLLNFIPVVGQLAGSIISAFGAIGFLRTVINVYNGNDAEESPVSFFKHMADLFTRYFCCSLWVFVKWLIGVIIMIVGMGMMIAGAGTGAAGFLSGGEIDASVISQGGALVIIGLIVYLAGLIVTLIISLKYSAYTYELVHEEDRSKRSRDIVNSAKEHLAGHVGQWFGMGFYYGVLMFVVMFLAGIVLGLIIAAIPNSLVVSLLSLALTIVIEIYFIPLLMCSYEEFFKDLKGDEAYVPAAEPAPAEEPVNSNPIQ